jgi:hypothetical protein
VKHNLSMPKLAREKRVKNTKRTNVLIVNSIK